METIRQIVHVFGEYPERATQIAISRVKAHLTELVRRAEAGDEIVLTRRCGS